MLRTLTLKLRKQDEWIIEELERTVKVKTEMGVATDLGIEVSRLLRQSMVGDYDQFLERAKDLGLFEVWKEKFKSEDVR